MRWYQKLKAGLSKTSSRLVSGIGDIVIRRRLDDAMLESLEETLIMADLGVEVAAALVKTLAEGRYDKEVSEEEVRTVLAAAAAEILEPVAHPLTPDDAHHPHVMVMIGVNGNGKTTTIGKLAQQYRREGKKVMLAAADTFRAAAVEQLQIWGERTGCPVIAGEHGADAASVAFRAYQEAGQQGMDVLLIDTAGRLQNKSNLMAELEKIIRVLQKQAENVPHDVVMVLDATTGQNALKQVETFRAHVPLSGLIVTKLDGTAKAGVVVSLAQKFSLPVHAIGVGEGVEDLQPFDPQEFGRSLMGLEESA